jgi:septum formation protein
LELILASKSPYRRDLLARLGLPFRCVAPNVDEAAIQAQQRLPQNLAATLAYAKAADVAARFPQAAVIGGDQVALCDGQILNKPGTVENARRQLALLSGRAHQLLTAVCVCSGERILEYIETTTLVMHELSEEAIRRYVEEDRPLDCAGSYKFEARGIALFRSVETTDPSAITGMPLLALGGMLRTLGFAVP